MMIYVLVSSGRPLAVPYMPYIYTYSFKPNFMRNIYNFYQTYICIHIVVVCVRVRVCVCVSIYNILFKVYEIKQMNYPIR